MGTPDYMAPEQATDAHTADTRADIYSLGCTLYYLLTGKVPYPGKTVMDKIQSHAEAQPQPIHQLRPDLPVAVVKVLERMMQKNSDDRYQSPAEVADALEPYSQSMHKRPELRWIVRTLIATAAAALLLLAAGFEAPFDSHRDKKGVLLTSTNGIDWQQVESPSTSAFHGIVYDGSRYILVGNNGMIWQASMSDLPGRK